MVNNNMALLIADSGSTKTDWILLDCGKVVYSCSTQGINPVHQTEEDIVAVLEDELIPQISGHKVGGVRFYGAGCRGKVVETIKRTLGKVFVKTSQDNIMAYSDLLGAARAVCGNNPGIACILGTGANSCVYDGSAITANIPPLGYILGDEGSGAVLGRMFLNAIFKDESLSGLRDEYLAWSGLTYDDIILRVYRQPMANRFLASVSMFVANHLENNAIRNIVEENFRAFFRNNVVRYNRQDLKVCAVGSVAFHYREQFCNVANEMGYEVGCILKSPIEGLANYHLTCL